MKRNNRNYSREYYGDYSRGQRSLRDEYTYGYSDYDYYYGSAAPKLDDYDDYDDYEDYDPRRSVRNVESEPEDNFEPGSRRLNLSMVALFVACFTVMSAFLVTYIGLQYEVTVATKEVASLQQELTTQKMRNDELLSAANKAINIDEIKYEAITRLGMKYADEDQIIAYENKVDDYVHQVSEVNN